MIIKYRFTEIPNLKRIDCRKYILKVCTFIRFQIFRILKNTFFIVQITQLYLI